MPHDTQQDSPRPPAAPDLPARVRLRWLQTIGIPFLGLLPALALIGVFDESPSQTSVSSRTLHVTARYPTRLRYKTSDTVELRVQNTSNHALPSVLVKFDEDYVTQFSNVTFTPEPQRAYELELADVKPGETRLISMEIEAKEYWRHAGMIRAVAQNDSALLNISTTVLP